jgi:hypothetical protein
MLQLLLPAIGAQADSDDGEAAARRLLEALADPREPAGANEVDVDRAETWSRRERLASKDFEQMSIDEHREALQLLQQGAREFRHVPTRRFRRNVRGRRPDLRRTLREVLRNNGEIAQLPRCARRLRPPTLVLICDISGSMSHYSRVFLQFAHTLCLRDQVVHSFLFGTRLTNISHRLADRDVDRAIAAISAEVRDWDGGTRIADSLQRFNHDWSRRVLAGRSVVVLLSDGLERDSGADLGFEMARLRRSCDLLVWLNPMLRYDEFAPLASGIRAMLPHVDRFQSAHNVASLLALGELVAGDGRGKLHAA